jgi:hypothetical protein
MLGKLVQGEPERDAVHIAVVAVVADGVLSAGMRVGFKDGGKVGRLPQEVIGIVDPFLTETVYPDDKFWMFLLPNTITSLKHNWTHPAFEGERPKSTVDPKVASEAWLRDFIKGADCPDYETVLAAAANGNVADWDEDYLHFQDRDAHGEIPPEFWDHVEIVTGRKCSKRPTYFSCAC